MPCLFLAATVSLIDLIFDFKCFGALDGKDDSFTFAVDFDLELEACFF
ncbi:hypothetical protein AVV48_gp40 [Acinetobacter phage phiAC-1]|nr:hypothetical protein AVV48_gp40 [Acinetobacter phage phiAC-1]AFU62289.1 hypothetical protein phiAC-1_0040 [Acinetobacter phage phiAC-1]